MRIEKLESAEDDLDRVSRLLEAERSGAGIRFLEAHGTVLDTLARFPQLYPLAEDGIPPHEIRNAFLERFEYRVVYLVRSEEVVILTIAHTRRHPRHWHRRLDEL